MGLGEDMNMHFVDFLKVKDEIWAYYIKWANSSNCGVALAISKDGINFEDKGFVLEPTEDAWDNKMASFPSVWYDDGTFYMVYEVSTEQPYDTAQWCHKFARSKDMENWEIADSIYPQTETSFGNDGPAWLVLDNKLYVYFRDIGNSTKRYELAVK